MTKIRDANLHRNTWSENLTGNWVQYWVFLEMNRVEDSGQEKMDKIRIKSKLERSESERKFLEKVSKMYPNCVVCKEKSEKFSSSK